MGHSLISFKGDIWRGKSTLATTDRGDRRAIRLENCYVAADGHELRSFPGWTTLVDLSEDNNAAGGYAQDIRDAVRPVYDFRSWGAGNVYADHYTGDSPDFTQTLWCRAKPLNYQWFEQVGDQLVIGGETRFREVPIHDDSGTALTLVEAKTTTYGGVYFLNLKFSGNPGSYSETDSGASLNGLAVGDTVYLEDLTVADATFQSELDSVVNGKVHTVKAINIAGNADQIVLYAALTTEQATGVILTAGTCRRVRGNYDDTYSTPAGMDPYTATAGERIDDLNALTTWRILPVTQLNINNSTSHTCYPAWVANRQRDFSDETGYFVEGIQVATTGANRGVSRREQRQLPYRMVPEPAGNRIIIAAPGYNCLFQVPLMVPFNPEGWPDSPTTDGLGIFWFGNDVYDKPRALGVPQCRLIDSIFTPAMPSPSDTENYAAYTHLVMPFDASPQYGFPSGTYRVCATYTDEVTGEEGLPSEVIEVTIPASDYAYSIIIRYFHPGYIMPECLALRLNVYISEADGEAMGFYKSFELSDLGNTDKPELGRLMHPNDGSPYGVSGKYGFYAGASPAEISTPNFPYGGANPPADAREWRSIMLPIPSSENTLADQIDFTRPPSQSSSMPRGASSARYIRGTLLTVGHIGTEGPGDQLWQGYGSIYLDATPYMFDEANELLIRQHDNTNLLDPADGDLQTGFGIAGHHFPDAYKGIQIVSDTLMPDSLSTRIQVDLIRNRKVADILDITTLDFINFERLKTVKKVSDPDSRSSLTSESRIPVIRENKPFYYQMMKGQIQVGDPAAPWRVTKAGTRGIQFIDPNKDDDGVAIGNLAGNAVVCSRDETYFLAWHRSAHGESPTLISNEYGCIAPNSMVEFDGGLAWLSKRGPVALGQGLQFVGREVQGDFFGEQRKYITDDRGMMRNAWSCHDASRGIVMWGLTTVDATHTWDDGEGGAVTVETADRYQLSRAPCNEVLIWSYGANAFSTWSPPSGMEIMWMRPIRVGTYDGISSDETRIAFLTADGRIHALDDAYADGNTAPLSTAASAKGANSTSLTVATGWKVDGDANARLGSSVTLRVGQVVEAFNSDDEIIWRTTIAAANSTTGVITLAEAQSWSKGQVIRVGARQPMVVETTYVGGEAVPNIETKAVHLRYGLWGAGKANANVQVLKSDINTTTAPKTVQFNPPDRWEALGEAVANERHSRRRQVMGDATAPEMAVKVTISSAPQVRLTELALEV